MKSYFVFQSLFIKKRTGFQLPLWCIHNALIDMFVAILVDNDQVVFSPALFTGRNLLKSYKHTLKLNESQNGVLYKTLKTVSITYSLYTVKYDVLN